MWRLTWLLVVCGCGRIGFDDMTGFDDATGFGTWSQPQLVMQADLGNDNEDVTLSSTMTELWFNSSAGGAAEIYVITRLTPADAWGAAQPFVANSTAGEGSPRLSVDDTDLFFYSYRGGGPGSEDIWMATRVGSGQSWGTPQPVIEVDTGAAERWLSPCIDGHYVLVRDAGSSQLFEGVLGSVAPAAIDELNTGGSETSAYLMPDCLTLYFASDRAGTKDIYVSHRASVATAWDPPNVIPEFSDPVANDEDPWMSADSRTFAYATDRDGHMAIYLATR